MPSLPCNLAAETDGIDTGIESYPVRLLLLELKRVKHQNPHMEVQSMSKLFAVFVALLVGSLVLTGADALAQQQTAPGAAAPAAQAKSVEGKIKSWDAATGMLTLDDGTQISVPPTVKLERDKIKEGASVKASYEVMGGKNVAKSIQVQ